MDDNTKINIFFATLLLAIVSFVFAGIQFGRWADIRSKEVKQVFVNDQLKKCEDAGGKYSLYYSDYTPAGYFERCKTLETVIKLK